MQALLALQDADSAAVILRWAAELRESNHASVPWHALGELPHPAVRAFLVRHVEEAEGSTAPSVRQALEAIAWFDGFHCWAGWTERVHAGEIPEIRRLVLERRGADAFFAEALDRPVQHGIGEGGRPRSGARHIDGFGDMQDFDADIRVAREPSGVVADAICVVGGVDAGEHAMHPGRVRHYSRHSARVLWLWASSNATRSYSTA